jgi:AcrR family transcriptional regulator
MKAPGDTVSGRGGQTGRRRRSASEPASATLRRRHSGDAAEPTASGDGAQAPSRRAAKSAERRAAIVAAGLQEFVARGYTATRLEDVARRAGVAKGTIYLYFTDKEALFQELIRSALVPVVTKIAPQPGEGQSARALLEQFVQTFVREIVETERADILRLILAEGARFPALAEFHYREVVLRGLGAIEQLISYGIARGEIHHTALAKFPQLVAAPALMAVIWQGLFSKHAPLDAAAMLRAHLDIIFDQRGAT